MQNFVTYQSIYFKTAYNHTVVVAKLNEMQMKGKHEEVITNFFNGLHRDHAGEFQQKVTGYCIIYAPYYICMLETEDGEFSDFLMREIHKTIGNFIHEQVWVLFATQEVSNTSFFLQLAASFRSLREPLTNSMCAHTLQTNRRLRSNRYQCSIECKRSTFQCCIWAVNVAE